MRSRSCSRSACPTSEPAGAAPMHFTMVQRILGLMVMGLSVTMLPPVVVLALYDDGHAVPFLMSFGIVLIAGLALWWPARRVDYDLRRRDGFLLVALFWLVL